MERPAYERLNQLIAQMETAHSEEGLALKKSLHAAYENMQPVNLLKNALQKISTPEVQNNLLKTGLSLAANYLINRITQAVCPTDKD